MAMVMSQDDTTTLPPMEELIWVPTASKETGMSEWWIKHNCDHVWKSKRRVYVSRVDLANALNKYTTVVEAYRYGEKVQASIHA